MGFAISRAFHEEGASVVLADVDASGLKEAGDRLGHDHTRVLAHECDVSSADDCASLVDFSISELGGVDVLVNNAGIGASVPLPELRIEDLDAVFAVNTRGPILLARALLPAMYEQQFGRIIQIASSAAKFGAPNISHYSASKAALIGFTRALAIEAVPHVTVNAVCPGIVNTSMMDRNIRDTMRAKGIDHDAAVAEWTSPIPMGRMQQPEDIAQAVLFLASREASEITGEALNVSGGAAMW
jgi:NAD(P)-dependent dehydrogenase (short-subunit alcohol dehydrogenase family)